MKQKLLILLAALMTAASVYAYDFEVDGIRYNKLNSTEVEVTSKGALYSGKINIPSTVTYKGSDYSVVSIGSAAFSCCAGLTMVEIPNSVTSIEDQAFAYCTGLISVEIPNSVTSIGLAAFVGCTGLAAIEIPNSVTTIGDSAFNGCSELTSIEIPNSVRSIGSSAFSRCQKLTSFHGKYASEDKRCLIIDGVLHSFAPAGVSSYNLPTSITSIGNYAFVDCSGLTSIEIPYSVTSIGVSAFEGCSGLTSIKIPNSVTTIKASAFSGCKSLTSIEIPNSVTVIGGSSFSGCTELISIRIGESVATIGDRAFSGCTGLTSIELPNSVTSIGEYAFDACTGLTSVEIPDSVTSIGGGAFNNCSGLTSVDYNAIKCTQMGGYGATVFNFCYALTKVTIGDNVEMIPDYAFSGCYMLCSILIPNSVTTIGASAFRGCSKLTSVEIGRSVTSISNDAFSDCSNLTSVAIPNSVISIGRYAFDNCRGLTSVSIGNSVTSIGNGAFKNCNLSEVFASWENPAGIEVGDDAFTSVHKITLYVPIGTTENYKYRSPWNNFKEIIEYMLGGNEGNERCATPVISVEDGKLVFSSPTPDAKYYYTIGCEDEHALTNSENGIVDLTGTYQISVYAYADGYDNSDIVTAILVWFNPQIEGAGVVYMEAKKAVLIRSVGDYIQLCGTEQGETIHLYSLDGKLLRTAKASDFETIIPFNAHKDEIYIIKYGDKVIKYKY